MAVHNPFVRIAKNAEKLSPKERPSAIAEAVGQAIPFVGTAGINVEQLTSTHVQARLRNDRSVHNHIGGMHAGATSLLAETVTGLIVAINVRHDCVPVLRNMEISYQRAVEGNLRAEAILTDDDAERIQSTEIGRISIAARLTDGRGNEPVRNELEWAWLPKRKAMGS